MKTNTPSKELLLTLLYKFTAQRAGLEFANYGDIKAYRSKSRSITKDGQTARLLIGAVASNPSITAQHIMDAARSAYSGRLEFIQSDKGWVIHYCAGQYFPTEYRRAVCAVCACALWAAMRADSDTWAPDAKLSIGERMHRNFRLRFGRSIQSRWFD